MGENNNNIYSSDENNNIDNNEETLNNSTDATREENSSEENTYPSGYQQDDMYYNRTNRSTNYNNNSSTSSESYDSTIGSNEYNNMNYNTSNNYSEANNNNTNFKDKFKKKPKVKKAKIKKSHGMSKKVAKICAAVAAFVVVAFGGGMLGGYLAGTRGTTSNGNTSNTVSPSDYAPAEFLNSSTDNDSETLTAAEAIEKVKPAVVTISTKTIVSSNNIFSSGEQEQEGIGSGFIINEEGYILTNYHVVEGSTEVKALLSTGEEVDATVVNYDEEKDIAMVKLADGTNIPGVAELGNSDAVYAGEEVIAIGTPLSKEFSATSTKGIVSAVNRDVETDTGTTMNLIQTDAAINPGNSGGPLINTKGQVIGINSMKIVVTEVEGIGFAIPINEAADRIETLSKPIITLGISIIEITDDLAKRNDLPLGLYVQDVTDFSAAQKAGIKIGDVITEFNGERIKTADDLSAEKEKLNVGDTVKVVVERNDKEVTLEMTLE